MAKNRFIITNHARDRFYERFGYLGRDIQWCLDRAQPASDRVKTDLIIQHMNVVGEPRRIDLKSTYWFLFNEVVFVCIKDINNYIVQSCWERKQEFNSRAKKQKISCKPTINLPLDFFQKLKEIKGTQGRFIKLFNNNKYKIDQWFLDRLKYTKYQLAEEILKEFQIPQDIQSILIDIVEEKAEQKLEESAINHLNSYINENDIIKFDELNSVLNGKKGLKGLKNFLKNRKDGELTRDRFLSLLESYFPNYKEK